MYKGIKHDGDIENLKRESIYLQDSQPQFNSNQTGYVNVRAKSGSVRDLNWLYTLDTE
jgi:hypothetical protein